MYAFLKLLKYENLKVTSVTEFNKKKNAMKYVIGLPCINNVALLFWKMAKSPLSYVL